jgi:predicted nuclease of predicted toxin-antitoxin system
MKILIDMNLSPDWVQTFAEDGIGSVHWSILEIGALVTVDVLRSRVRILPIGRS